MVPHYWELPPTGHYGQQAVNGQQGLWSQSWIQSSLLRLQENPLLLSLQSSAFQWRRQYKHHEV